eukprot:6325457-Prorocentrum_lima.AAC.1
MTRNTCRNIGCPGRPEQSRAQSTKRYSEMASPTPTPRWPAPRPKEKAKEQDTGKETVSYTHLRAHETR